MIGKIIKNKNTARGITLISLVIMIIVLLILASIASYSGVSTIKYTKFIRAKAQIETMQTEVNTWYQEYNNGSSYLSSYGTEVNYADYTEAFNAAGVSEQKKTEDNYRLFTASYLESLGINGINYDFLISIKERDVFLAYGINYEDITYYTAEDFGISNVKSATPVSSITYKVAIENVTTSSADVIIYDLVFSNDNGDVEVSKFNVKYQTVGSSYWNDVTSLVKTSYTDSNSVNYSNAYKFKIDTDGEYTLKISTTDKKVEGYSDNFTIELSN